ncbi:unnamed protein product [Peronospora belbahrii]|uniref:Pentacotripeptide-repeat region of PRORP domain-containing protein n=1 Tax=Peronospora belbahrii TaxID=622444 RepID=A0AAU9L4Z7_9STRA|nr:unnamed protein product [Peronospora belbahrii]CAH0522025.1 unnamed protein product [Peronospora belbahrii]
MIWSHASDFVAWLGLGHSKSLDSSTSPTKQPSAKCEKTLPTRPAFKRAWRSQFPDDTLLPTIHRSQDRKKKREAAQVLGRFSQKVKHVPTSKQLLDIWQIVSQCRPFVIQQEEPLQVRLASSEDLGDDCPWLLQIVPANVFAQLSADISARTLFLGSTKVDMDDADVAVTNENLILGNIVQAFHGMNEHKLAVAFFEAYDRDRSVWLQEDQLLAAAKLPLDVRSDGAKEDEAKLEPTEKHVPIEKATRLYRSVYALYLRSLAALKQPEKIIRLFENDKHQLERMCYTIPSLRLILRACFDQKNGVLARQAIDTISKCSPAAVIPLGCYELAIRANLRDRNRKERDLLSAIHLARALLNDGGYILKPDLWSALVKVSLSMRRPDLALDIFKTYPRHCVPEYQSSFRQVLWSASRLADPTALEMMHFCWFSYDAAYPNAKALFDERKAYKDVVYLNNPDVKGLLLGNAVLASSIPAINKEAETEMLNTMLWALLKHRRAMSSIVQVLDLMEATGSKGAAVTLRKAVLRMFEYDMVEKKMSSRAAVESSLKFWKEHSSVLHGQGFLVHLLLEECIDRRLDDECEFLVNYLIDLGVSRVPIGSIVKMMGVNELRGHFEANARIGHKLLQQLSKSNRGRLCDEFYERYLMSYLLLEQFDKVSQEYVNLNLEQRYPHNEVIRTIVQDAAAREDQLGSKKQGSKEYSAWW